MKSQKEEKNLVANEWTQKFLVNEPRRPNKKCGRAEDTEHVKCMPLAWM